MSYPPVLSDAVRALAVDHQRVDELATRLRSADDLATLAAVLEELGRILVAHFAHEESPGGIYEVMGVQSPELRTPLGDLVAEHYALICDIRSLASRVRDLLQLGHADLLAEARALADRLASHERKEAAIAPAGAPGPRTAGVD